MNDSTSRPMRFAISIPQFVTDGSFDPGAFRAYLRRAEDLGFRERVDPGADPGHVPTALTQ